MLEVITHVIVRIVYSSELIEQLVRFRWIPNCYNLTLITKQAPVNALFDIGSSLLYNGVRHCIASAIL